MLKFYLWRFLATLVIAVTSFNLMPVLAQAPTPARPPLLYLQTESIADEASNLVPTDNLFRLNPDGSSTRLTNFSDRTLGITSAPISPNQQQIIFSTVKGNLIDSIYTMNIDGSNLTRLVGDGLKGMMPVWSPDGTRVAFSGGHNSEGVGTIFSSNLAVMNADGSNQKIIVPESNILTQVPLWLADGQRLIFEGTDDDYFSHLYSIHADGSGLICFTCPPPSSGNLYGPNWYMLTLSPTGQQAAYVGRDNELYVVNVNSGEQRNLTATLNERPIDPTWSPDGQRLAFGLEDAQVALGVVNADGANLTLLPVPPGPSYAPVWSPDGQKIAFTHYPIPEEGPGEEKLYVINTDGTGLTQLTPDAPFRFIENYVWTPDSAQLIYGATIDNDNSGYANYALYQVNANGSNLTRLINDPPNFSARFAAWLPQ